MKKILLLIMLVSCFGYSQTTKESIKNFEGIEVTGIYKIRNTKNNKTEYSITVVYENTTDKEIFFKKNSKSKNFALVRLKGMKSYVFPLSGSETRKKIGKQDIIVLYPGEKYETFVYFPWYDNPEVPEFEFELNKAATLENDYSRYN